MNYLRNSIPTENSSFKFIIIETKHLLSNREYEGFINQAKMLYANDYDDRYISLQLADNGVPDKDIDLIMKEIKALRKHNLRQQGAREVVLGILFIAAGMFIAQWLIHSGFIVKFVAIGMPMGGLLLLVKGLFNILNW